jgi:hypothetical protein
MDQHLEHDRPEPWWRSPKGRIGLALAGLVVVLGVLKFSTQAPAEMKVLSVPSPLSQDPAEVRRRLQQAGVTQFEYANGQLHVPAESAESAATAIQTEDTTGQHWADEWEAANAKLGHFSGSREREAAREIARARQISRMLTRMPGIDHADVVWDDDHAAGWNREAKSRATVYLKPKPGSEITPEIIRSVRSAVAGSKANLAAESVIVMDLDRRITYEATLDEPLLRQQDQQRDERAAIYRRRIEQLLQHVDGIRVGVFIDDVPFATKVDHPWADPLGTGISPSISQTGPLVPSFGEPRFTRNEKSSSGRDSKSAAALLGIHQEMAELVHVHLAVPEEFYLRKLEMADVPEEISFEQIERDVNQQLQKRVNDALPDSGPSPEVVVDLIPGERIASVPVAATPHQFDELKDPTVLYPLCGVGLVFFALAWAIVAARRGPIEETLDDPVSGPVAHDPSTHVNPLEFLATSARFSDWLPALLMESAEDLARVVSVLPSQQVGELLARLPVGVQIDVLQAASRQPAPTTEELVAIARRLEQESEIPTFLSQNRSSRVGAS